jgi:hypothetical protein
MLFYGVLYLLLGVLRAGIEVFLGIDHMGKGLGILSYGGDVNDPGDIRPATADKYSHTGFLSAYIDLWRVFLLGD